MGWKYEDRGLSQKEAENILDYEFSDGVFTMEGCISLQHTSAGVIPWRIDADHLDFYPVLKDGVAKTCSGTRLVFTTDSQTVVLRVVDPEPELRADLVIGGELAATAEASGGQLEFSGLPAGEKDLEIWLDPRFPCHIRNLSVDRESRIRCTNREKPRWVHYGSSISHSTQAHSPARTWAALTARRLGLHLTNLGFGGNCVFEPMVARLIRDQPADYITLKLGINVHGGAVSERTFSSSVIGLIQIIREKHPLTPLVVISPIFSPNREKTKAFPMSLTLEEMRSELCQVTEICRAYGDAHIYYVDGLTLIGPSELHYMPDRLHPDGDGQFVIADRMIKNVFQETLCPRV